MNYREIRNKIGADPLFIAYVRAAQNQDIVDPSSQIHSGKILTLTGRYTMISHCVIESLMYALSDSPKTCWQLFIFLMRNISGRVRDGRNNLPKTFIEYKATKIIEKANIKGIASFYKAMEKLEEKEMIYKKNGNIYVNLFPLTWNIENNIKEKIEIIVEKEIERIESGAT